MLGTSNCHLDEQKSNLLHECEPVISARWSDCGFTRAYCSGKWYTRPDETFALGVIKTCLSLCQPCWDLSHDASKQNQITPIYEIKIKIKIELQAYRPVSNVEYVVKTIENPLSTPALTTGQGLDWTGRDTSPLQLFMSTSQQPINQPNSRIRE